MKPRENEAAWSEQKQKWRIDVQRDGKHKSFYSFMPGTEGKAEAERKAGERYPSNAGSNTSGERLIKCPGCGNNRELDE